MKNYCLAVLIFCSTLFGQENDFSFWSRNSSVYLWYLYTGKKVVLDVRHNFDAVNTAGVCLGKKFGKESLTLVPEACGYVGNPSFIYHWTDVQREVTKKLSLGFGEQIFKELSDASGQIDIGPSSKLTFGKVYFRIWPAWSVGPANRGARTVFLGVGYAW